MRPLRVVTHAAVMLGETLRLGGATRDEEDEDVILGDLCVAAVAAYRHDRLEKANVMGQAPCARKGASFQVVRPRPSCCTVARTPRAALNDAYVLDAEDMEWRAVYKAASELILHWHGSCGDRRLHGEPVRRRRCHEARRGESLNVAEKAAEFDFIPAGRAPSPIWRRSRRVQNQGWLRRRLRGGRLRRAAQGHGACSR